MTDFTISSFNVKNLIGAEQEYYRFEEYTPEEYAWKEDWLARQILTMDADIICFQEIFDEAALKAVIDEVNSRGQAQNDAVIPPENKRYGGRKIFEKIKFEPYETTQIRFAPNSLDGAPGQRRPGVAVLSRFGFVGDLEILQDLPEPLTIPFADLGGHDGGSYTIRRLSRPILKVKIPVGDQVITVFNCHLKSKLGEFPAVNGAPAPETDLLTYDPVGRAMGSLRSALRRMTEAWVLRDAVVQALNAGEPVMVLGDFNDSEHSVSSEIIRGETPFKNYSWMRRPDAKHRNDRYKRAENDQIQEDIRSVQLYSAEKLFVRKSLRDMVYTASFGGVFESIDQIFLSRHFHPDNPERLGDMAYFSVLNDHLTDGSHPEAPHNKLASDHGQIIAHMQMR